MVIFDPYFHIRSQFVCLSIICKLKVKWSYEYSYEYSLIVQNNAKSADFFQENSIIQQNFKQFQSIL